MTPFARYIEILLRLRRESVAPVTRKQGVRSRLTRDEKLELVARWRDSGMSAREFAERAGLHPMTFGNWTRGLYLGGEK